MSNFRCPECRCSSTGNQVEHDQSRQDENDKQEARYREEKERKRKHKERVNQLIQAFSLIKLDQKQGRKIVDELNKKEGYYGQYIEGFYSLPLPTWFIRCPVCHNAHYFYKEGDS